MIISLRLLVVQQQLKLHSLATKFIFEHYLSHGMMTLHFLNDLANDAESTQK